MGKGLNPFLNLASIQGWMVAAARLRPVSTTDLESRSVGERPTMTKTLGLRGFAAIGGLTATIALLTGLPAAVADELADLRANQELLQRRIEQLAQATKQYPGVPGAMGTEPTPGTALVGGSFPRSFLIPGTDTSIRLGGFVDITGLYYLQGANSGNPGLPSTNSGQNGNLNSVPIGQQL